MTYKLLFSALTLFSVNTHLLSMQLISSQDITENIVAQEDTKIIQPPPYYNNTLKLYI